MYVTVKTFSKIGAFFCKGLPACMHIGHAYLFVFLGTSSPKIQTSKVIKYSVRLFIIYIYIYVKWKLVVIIQYINNRHYEIYVSFFCCDCMTNAITTEEWDTLHYVHACGQSFTKKRPDFWKCFHCDIKFIKSL